MATPRYSITLSCGSMKVTQKLKSVLGDVEGLKQELARLQEENGFKSLADYLANKYGGLDKAKKRWYDEYIVLIGVCDVCSGALDYDCKITDNADGSANVVCKSCCSKSG